MEENIKENKWWKIIALLVIGILLGIVVGVKFISAINWPLNKEATCNMFNITGVSCETFWCNNIQGGNYSTQNETCVVREIINETIIYNVSNNSTGNYTVYYGLNETERKAELEKYLGINLSQGNAHDLILGEAYNFTENETLEYMKKLYANSSNNEDYEPTASRKSNAPVGLLILLAMLLVFVVILGIGMLSKKKMETFDENSNARQSRKIQPMNELSKDEKIRLLERELKKSKKTPTSPEQNKNTSPSSKVKEEITLEEDDDDDEIVEED